MVGRSLDVEVADDAGFRAAFDLDVVAIDASAAAGRVVLCSQGLRNRSVLEAHLPDATRLWLEHHFANRAADAGVLYDVDGSFAPTAAALRAAGRDLRYFPHWHGMPVPATRGAIQQTAALHHCIAVARELADWALHIDPDEYVVCRGGDEPLAGILNDPARPDAILLDRAFFTTPEPHKGKGLPTTRFPELCRKTPKAFFRTSTAASPDVHRLLALRASAGRRPRTIRADGRRARINHYNDLVVFRNRTDCEDSHGTMIVVQDDWGLPGEPCRPLSAPRARVGPGAAAER
ncbi:hypothetical protein DFJ74DRAFT_669033 [Hyaloraphidium curvatum]|nr:hypothetical protein DFJ74DRAFT_669033 [Hyaloraphidium curvatum]